MSLVKRLMYSALLIPNHIFKRSLDWTNRPVFYDIDGSCPELRLLERHSQTIKAEFDRLKGDLHVIPAYQDVDHNQKCIAQSRRGSDVWRVFFLKALGRDVEPNRSLCPQTAAAIDRLSNVFQACFSILEGGKSVPSHCNPYNGYLRYHLGIEVPRKSPPSILVKDQPYSWREGAGVLFDDTWPHEIRNHSPEIRVVLIVDIARPMSGVANLVNRAMFLLMRHTYAYVVVRRAGYYSRAIVSNGGMRIAAPHPTGTMGVALTSGSDVAEPGQAMAGPSPCRPFP
jgi:aspartate beta-hydroxylase